MSVREIAGSVCWGAVSLCMGGVYLWVCVRGRLLSHLRGALCPCCCDSVCRERGLCDCHCESDVWGDPYGREGELTAGGALDRPPGPVCLSISG